VGIPVSSAGVFGEAQIAENAVKDGVGPVMVGKRNSGTRMALLAA